MDFNWLDLIASFAAGMFGAAIGALPAFILMGFFILIGITAALGGSGYDIVNTLGFGPLFGPHIAFAGGVAAADYASFKEWTEDGKDILPSLAGVNKPSVLIVGGIFGALGYMINSGLVAVIGEFTDTIALTVIISAIIARLAFGKTGLFSVSEEGEGRFFRW